MVKHVPFARQKIPQRAKPVSPPVPLALPFRPGQQIKVLSRLTNTGIFIGAAEGRPGFFRVDMTWPNRYLLLEQKIAALEQKPQRDRSDSLNLLFLLKQREEYLLAGRQARMHRAVLTLPKACLSPLEPSLDELFLAYQTEQAQKAAREKPKTQSFFERLRKKYGESHSRRRLDRSDVLRAVLKRTGLRATSDRLRWWDREQEEELFGNCASRIARPRLHPYHRAKFSRDLTRGLPTER